MAFSSWRGVVGMINPTLRPGVTEEVIRLLPEGIGLIPLFLNIRRGTEDEFATMMPAYEELIAVLAECGCDLIHPHGAPPFMVQGRKREAEIIKAWEKKYKTPIMSVAQNHVNALKTLKAKTILGATYFPPKLNAIFAKYFRDAGFTVRGMAGIDVPDGTVLAKLERAVPQLAIQGHPNAQFDPAKFTWLGSLSSYADDAYLMLINASHAAKTVADLKGAGMPVVLGADNAASSNLIFAVIAKEVLGLNVNVVRGYTGAAPLFLAMQRGELDGQMVGLSSVRTGQRDLWTRGAFRPLMAFGRTRRHAAFPDMPIARELTDEAGALALIEFAELPFFMALPFAAPPDVPPDRAKALQTAFMAVCRDKTFVEEAEKLGIDMSPVDSDAILTLLARTAATPNDVIARYNAIGGERK
jgi:maleate cis-trans isomerase/tripartite-type tricarboxylate transporter receptor subunit TctC